VQRIGFIVLRGFQVMSCAVMAVFELANRAMSEPIIQDDADELAEATPAAETAGL
jgi:hypothetical protein